MLAAMAHRGPDGAAARTLGWAVIGHLHFWTTPEEEGERQPLPLPSGGGLLAFDGRLDNREELWRALPDPRGPLARLSDGALAALAYDAWGSASFGRFLGPFALALLDHRSRRVILARDPLGDRCLSYSLSPHRLVAASEDAAVLAVPGVDGDLDPGRLAAYFALTPLPGGWTFHRGVRQVEPGCFLEVTARGTRQVRYYQPPELPEVAAASPEDNAHRFREAFEAAVRCRMRSRRRPAVLLSGGLDSAPVAALAARELPAGEPLTTVSWVFDRYPRADERRYLDALTEALGLRSRRFAGDDLGPLGELDRWPTHPSSPEQNAYRRLHERAYRMVRQEGTNVLLTGMLGDHLYTGEETWLADALQRGRLLQAAGDLAWHLGRREPLRPVLRSLLPEPAQRALGSLRRRRPRRWLTDHAHRLLATAPEAVPGAYRERRPRQHLRLLGAGNGNGLLIETYYAGRHGLELRYPLRDRRLVELALALPTAELYHRGVHRPVLRRALAGVLPQAILARRDKADCSELFAQGLYRDNRATVRGLLDRPGARWKEFTDRLFIEDALNKMSVSTGGLLVWLAVSLELWLSRREEAARKRPSPVAEPAPVLSWENSDWPSRVSIP
jgi:asparagine synthase (glutamine-hydrolysing)